jgi:ABC-type Mn2+/Zn2+ transport system ATPase subunit
MRLVMDDSPTVLSVSSLSLGYGRHTVLSGVDLEVREGEIWFLVGPNGSGKTTLLRAMLGLLPPRSGSLHRDPERASRRNTGFVPQRCDLNPSLPTTLGEFVRLGAVGLHLSAGDLEDRLQTALGQVGLGGLSRADYWSLSGGQRQRALVARALVRRPRLLILDEPTNGLDLAAEEALLHFLVSLNRNEGVTLIFVTHDLRTAASHATHVALFGPERVEAGPRGIILTEENLSRAYGVAVEIAARRVLESHSPEAAR